jgi:hypothetical protein
VQERARCRDRRGLPIKERCPAADTLLIAATWAHGASMTNTLITGPADVAFALETQPPESTGASPSTVPASAAARRWVRCF